ncbi:MAG: hypothetical protein KC468_13780, partial [Myxococcales bacterium]|nr:hypothetical protein [Myxococcales bacterium]
MTSRDEQAPPSADAAPPELSVGAVLDPVTLDALDDVRRRQLEIASRLYSGNAESAETILGRGEEDDGDERIHPRFVELRTIVDQDGVPRYDAWLYMVDSGTIFEAGTETVIAEVIQFGLEIDDAVLERALDPLLGSLKPRKAKKAAKKKVVKTA